MNTVAENVVRNYVDWLQQYTEIKTMEDGWERITLPFTDRHGDFLQFYVTQKADGSYVITDDGYVLSDPVLRARIASKPRELQEVLASYDVQLVDGERLERIAPAGAPAIGLNSFVQVMLAINGL